jgi:ATP-dependent Clp protease adaptor protein ClpS
MTMSEGQSNTPGAPERPETPGGDGGGTAVQTRPARPRTRRLPPWKVLLHNDDVNHMEDVIDAIVELTTLRRQEAILRMLEAHTKGLTLLLTTHREHAELLQEQFTSKRLTVTIEPEG